MRAITVLVPLFATACIEPETEFADLGDPTSVRFLSTSVARGGTASIDHEAPPGLPYDITSSNPNILRVERAADGFRMVGVADGEVTLEAVRTDTDRFLASTKVRVEPVMQVVFAFDPAGDLPLSRIAALPGASEKLRVHATGSKLGELPGAQGVISFVYTGGVAGTSTSSAESRLGRFDPFNSPHRTGYETAFRIDSVGPARITAIADGREVGALDLEVVAAPETVSIVFGNNPAPKSFFEVAGLVGTANGLPLAGLIGDFTADPPNLLQIPDPHAGEAFMQTGKNPGVVTITATLPDRVVTATLEIR